MEEPFTRIVSQIFNNWTALRLAVDHSMGGPNTKQIAVEFMNYVVQYCICNLNVQVEDIQTCIEDILDEEFETVCEDDSPKHIAQLLHMFLNLLREGKTEECEVEFKKLPVTNADWLAEQRKAGAVENHENEPSSEDSSSDEEVQNSSAPMEQDEWVEVKSRRKR